MRSSVVCFGGHLRRPIPVGLGSGAWLVVGAFAALGATVLIVPFATGAPAIAVGTLLPSALCLSLPLAAVPALILASALRSIPPQAARWLALRAAILLTAIMLPLAGWVMPGFNQTWRELNAPADYRRPVLRGDRELTLSELFRPGVSAMVPELLRKREIHNRVAVILMPISLSALGLAASRRVRRRFRGAVLWWIFSGALWFFATLVALGLMHRTFFVWTPWAPHIAMLIVTALLRAGRSNPSPIDRDRALPAEHL